MTILVTGGSGFVGRYFLKNSRGSIALDARVDLIDKDKLKAFLTSHPVKAVIHLAAKTHVLESFSDPRGTYEVNFLGTLNLLEALKETHFTGRFLYVGSSEVYGRVEESLLPIGEEQVIRPRNPYAVSKASAEALCYQWSQTGDFEIILARPFNHIGPGQDSKFVISSFAKQVAEIKLGRKKPEIVCGDINVTRDFTDVRDVVNAYLLLLEKGKNGETYNICSGVENSLESILKKLFLCAKVQASIVCNQDKIRPNEQKRMLGSYKKIGELGWLPKIPMIQTLQDILDYWEQALLCEKEH